MEFRDMMWELFVSTGNLDAYLAYRACIDLDFSQNGAQCGSALNIQKEIQANNLPANFPVALN